MVMVPLASNYSSYAFRYMKSKLISRRVMMMVVMIYGGYCNYSCFSWEEWFWSNSDSNALCVSNIRWVSHVALKLIPEMEKSKYQIFSKLFFWSRQGCLADSTNTNPCLLEGSKRMLFLSQKMGDWTSIHHNQRLFAKTVTVTKAQFNSYKQSQRHTITS